VDTEARYAAEPSMMCGSTRNLVVVYGEGICDGGTGVMVRCDYDWVVYGAHGGMVPGSEIGL
jgi:hypothetical protein